MNKNIVQNKKEKKIARQKDVPGTENLKILPNEYIELDSY